MNLGQGRCLYVNQFNRLNTHTYESSAKWTCISGIPDQCRINSEQLTELYICPLSDMTIVYMPVSSPQCSALRRSLYPVCFHRISHFAADLSHVGCIILRLSVLPQASLLLYICGCLCSTTRVCSSLRTLFSTCCCPQRVMSRESQCGDTLGYIADSP